MQTPTTSATKGWLSDGLLHAIYESAKENPFDTLLALLAVVCFFKLLSYRLKRVQMDHDLVKTQEANLLARQVQQHKHEIDLIEARKQVNKE